MASIWTLKLLAISVPHRVSSTHYAFRSEFGVSCSNRTVNWKSRCRQLVIRASGNLAPSDKGSKSKDEMVLVNSESNSIVASKQPIARLQETIISLPPVVFLAKNVPLPNFAVHLCIAATLLFVAVRVYVAGKTNHKRPGSVADLVRRGQLKSDRRGKHEREQRIETSRSKLFRNVDIKQYGVGSDVEYSEKVYFPNRSKPLKYEDPFNNPLVKVDKSNTTVEMCGKVYRLAPVTLTTEEQSIHQKRRSRAYQWKRPTIFLKEGDSIPSDVDPDTVRWIPANHPFATTASDISEDLAQNNVYQKHGVPFRIQAEHEALQKKLEALQSDQKFNHLVIDPGTARNFERPFKSNLKDEKLAEQVSSNSQMSSPKPSQSGSELDSHESSNSSSEGKQTP